jgi:hypothetical protein
MPININGNEIILRELSEVIQSSNLNFLFGAGTSFPFLPVLGNIETELNKADSDALREAQYKKYCTDVMLPNKNVIDADLSGDAKYQETKKSYSNFFQSAADILLRRKSTILSKQANVFTTNIDVLMENILEELQIEYNDGFSGKFTPTFSIANFKKSILQRSLHYEHVSEIPLFNIIKVHGSLTWKLDVTNSKVTFSHKLDHFDDSISKLGGDDFKKAYNNIMVVNPEEAKHLESVLNVYYSELLRIYSSELEKENATLFVVGFSMEDRHIREITLRAAKSNPTLRIFICSSQGSSAKMETKMEVRQHPNILVFETDAPSAKFTLKYLVEHVFDKISLEKDDEE